MYCKLGLWYFALVIIVPLTTANYRVVLFFTGSYSGPYYKSFRIVIYDLNDSTIVEPVL
jgi:hypothetical protein